MSFNATEFRGFIAHVLSTMQLHSPSAVNLALGTCAKESDFGKHRRQIGGGPALGVMQIEPDTFAWMRRLYGRRYGFENRIFRELEQDDRLSVMVARLRYLVIPEPLPAFDDVEGMARYWKKYYNTEAGAGRPEEFVAKFHEYVGGHAAA